eukprot:Rhum_TRINITY_DN14654_c5_g1::Rhum_TRINITY_DN14654_c5_g1_i1::g.106306::m.106306
MLRFRCHKLFAAAPGGRLVSTLQEGHRRRRHGITVDAAQRPRPAGRRRARVGRACALVVGQRVQLVSHRILLLLLLHCLHPTSKARKQRGCDGDAGRRRRGRVADVVRCVLRSGVARAGRLFCTRRSPLGLRGVRRRDGAGVGDRRGASGAHGSVHNARARLEVVQHLRLLRQEEVAEKHVVRLQEAGVHDRHDGGRGRRRPLRRRQAAARNAGNRLPPQPLHLLRGKQPLLQSQLLLDAAAQLTHHLRVLLHLRNHLAHHKPPLCVVDRLRRLRRRRRHRRTAGRPSAAAHRLHLHPFELPLRRLLRILKRCCDVAAAHRVSQHRKNVGRRVADRLRHGRRRVASVAAAALKLKRIDDRGPRLSQQVARVALGHSQRRRRRRSRCLSLRLPCHRDRLLHQRAVQAVHRARALFSRRRCVERSRGAALAHQPSLRLLHKVLHRCALAPDGCRCRLRRDAAASAAAAKLRVRLRDCAQHGGVRRLSLRLLGRLATQRAQRRLRRAQPRHHAVEGRLLQRTHHRLRLRPHVGRHLAHVVLHAQRSLLHERRHQRPRQRPRTPAPRPASGAERPQSLGIRGHVGKQALQHSLLRLRKQHVDLLLRRLRGAGLRQLLLLLCGVRSVGCGGRTRRRRLARLRLELCEHDELRAREKLLVAAAAAADAARRKVVGHDTLGVAEKRRRHRRVRPQLRLQLRRQRSLLVREQRAAATTGATMKTALLLLLLLLMRRRTQVKAKRRSRRKEPV